MAGCVPLHFLDVLYPHPPPPPLSLKVSRHDSHMYLLYRKRNSLFPLDQTSRAVETPAQENELHKSTKFSFQLLLWLVLNMKLPLVSLGTHLNLK